MKNDDAELMGDYYTAKAKSLVLKFDMCVDEPTTPLDQRKCKDPEEIKHWMRRKFLLTLENQVTFNKDIIEYPKLSKSSRLVWNVLSPQNRIEMYNYVSLTKLDLRDEISAIVSTPEEFNMFTSRPGPIRMYDYFDNTQLAITYELDRDLFVIRRKVYGLLDFMGDLGGLAGALRGLFSVVVLIF